MALSHILYRSLGRVDRFSRDCDEILTSARARNLEYGLTGFLHGEDGVFLQWLEGPLDALNYVTDLILSDSRHREITIFSRGGIETRQFPDWAMGFSTGESAPLFDYLADQEINSHDQRAYADGLHRFLLQRAA
ncbi:MAG: BLUF domain-containing protein [Paracoccus denitrificans]|uniref:BLUF domain-containing protein n=1 Tax=Paracoccus denitrificans TaxID=266 RepID=A0A533I5X1_PARDE|nr:MAG: BLUF domain-containing protein [Paracoccus denitrificans]